MRAVVLMLCCLLACPSIGLATNQQSNNFDPEKEYARAAAQIVGSSLVEGAAYERLSYLTDRIGHRLSGSPQLEQAVKWAVETLKADGLDNVHAEPVMVPHWVRGDESAEITAPAKHRLSILGLGGTVGTPAEGITAEVIEINSYEELEKSAAQVKGKIVLYNAPMRKDLPPFTAYGDAVKFRGTGASNAAKYGAVATLVRSVTTRSLSTPHTGSLRYLPDLPQIPAAAVTVENADLIHRLLARGDKVTVNLKLGAKTLPDVQSANVIAELRGREKPDEVVVISGHLDSWDVGTGAQDDGAGCIVAMEALRILAKLNLRPRRTIRVVLFTNEENGLRGGVAYGAVYKNALEKHIAAIEADAGGARPIGYSFEGKDGDFAKVQKIAPLLNSFGAGEITKGFGGADISVITNQGVPGLGLRPEPTHYFDIHHTEADTLDKISQLDLSLNVASMAIMAYVLADMPETLTRQ